MAFRAALLIAAALALPGGTALGQAAMPRLAPHNQMLLQKARTHVTPGNAAWVRSETLRVQSGAVPPDQVLADGQTALLGLNSPDISALCFVVLMDATRSMQNDMQSIMQQTKAVNAAKAAQRQSLANAKDSVSDMSQEQQLKMQMLMERMTKADQAASNLEKKISDTDSSIIKNMK